MSPLDILSFFVLVYTFGPAAAIPYGLAFMPGELILVVLFFCYALPVPALLYMLNKLEFKNDYENKLMNEVVSITRKQIAGFRKMSNQIIETFIDWWGDLGYDIALVFISFALGFIIASIAAFLIKLPRKRAYVAIFCGNLVGLLFWYAVSVGMLEIGVDSTFFIILSLFLAITFYLYGQAREKRILRDIVKALTDGRKKR
jgi:uncharacterized membrane protein